MRAQPRQGLRARELGQSNPAGFTEPQRCLVAAVGSDPGQFERAEALGQQRRRVCGRDERSERVRLVDMGVQGQVRKRVRYNVVLLCDELPAGKGTGRPSKALTLKQAEAVLAAAESSPMRAYIVVSLLTGARTEEMRPLTWDHVDLVGKPKATPAIPPNVKVWRSVRARGETKTRKSRRTLALPARAVKALEAHREAQKEVKANAGDDWQEHGLVFATNVGTERDVNNVRRDFRRVIKAAGLNPTQWTPRELRHSFVSILSDGGMPIEEISRLVGHSSTAVAELVYRKQIRPVVESGATAMDRLFPATGGPAELPASRDQAS